MELTSRAVEGLRKIHALRKYPVPQTPIAVERILKTLNTVDYTQVVLELERTDTGGGQ